MAEVDRWGQGGIVRFTRALRVCASPALLSVLVLLLPGTAVAARAAPPSAVPAAPAPPSGWTLTFADDFSGAAGTGVNASNWKYDTGTGFGTGEIENMTTSTANVFQDGSGHL